MTEFAGKVALITGGSRGVGRAAAHEFARRGADLAIVFKSRRDLADKVTSEIRSRGVKCLALQADLADADATRRAFERAVGELGRLDVLVHSAGAQVSWRPVREHDPKIWADFIANDLVGGFNAIQQAVRHMRAAKSGVIVAISSIASQMCQSRNSQGAAAKAGLEALIRVVAREEARSGIRANAIPIGLTDTEQTQEAMAQWGPEAAKKVVDAIPLGRIGRPEEVAKLCAFLASEDASYITGKLIQLDGGQIICG
jgi:NAD(P)-dependent dehydrogenase (short-subunit alcohol dehydrogenase family)